MTKFFGGDIIFFFQTYPFFDPCPTGSSTIAVKPTSLLLALRKRQLSIPLVFFEVCFFVVKTEFLQTHSMLEKSQNWLSLVENGKQTSKYMNQRNNQIIKYLYAQWRSQWLPQNQNSFIFYYISWFPIICSHSGHFEINHLICTSG